MVIWCEILHFRLVTKHLTRNRMQNAMAGSRVRKRVEYSRNNSRLTIKSPYFLTTNILFQTLGFVRPTHTSVHELEKRILSLREFTGDRSHLFFRFFFLSSYTCCSVNIIFSFAVTLHAPYFVSRLLSYYIY